MPLIKLSNGKLVHRYAEFQSAYTAPHNVDVWLPPDALANRQRCAVLYMHDGQNLFDGSMCIHGSAWDIDDAITRLMDEGVIPPVMVVGIWSSPARWRDYMPQSLLEQPQAATLRQQFAEARGGTAQSDGYLRFLVEELKPAIDADFPALPDRAHTFLMGSSMGGLISLYALEQYPQVFGGAGCLSTHWPAGGNLLVDWLGQRLPQAGDHRLYFDYGSQGLDADYAPYQQRMDAHLRLAGYREQIDWISLSFPGTDHNETAWRSRVALPVRFLLEERR